MRKSFKVNIPLTVFAILLTAITSQLFAQATSPGIFFQAVARDSYANPAKDRQIYVVSSIIQYTTNGTVVLVETHQTSTDATGVFGINIGYGKRTGGTVANLDKVDWSRGPYFLNLKIAINPIAPVASWDYTNDLIDLGTSPLGSVPYALYAGSVAGFDNKLNTADTTKMLSSYARVANLNSLVTNKVNVADSTTIYVTPSQLKSKTFDSTNIYNQLALKANNTDVTAAINLKENLNNKSIDVSADGTSDLKYPSAKAVKTYIDAQVVSASIPDAAANAKGKIQLAGDLSGSASAPAVATNAITTSKVADGAITNSKIASGIDGAKISGDITGKAANITGNLAIVNGGTGANSASNARTNLGLVIGTDVQAPLTFNAPIIKNANTVSINQAAASVDGYLSAADFTSFNNKIDATQKAANNGVATLGNDGKIPSAQIPAISFQSATVVNSQATMLALSGAIAGSIAIRTDVNKNFVLSATPAATLSNWIELATPSSVTSVNGFAGPSVVLTSNDIAEGSNNKYYTDTRTRSALSASSPMVYNNGTGAFSIPQSTNSVNGFLSATDFATFNNKQNAIVAGVDYLAPNGSAANLTSFPTLNQNTTGNAATATNAITAGNITATSNTTLTSLANLTTVGTITAGTWSGSTIALTKGGTGATTAAAALINLGAEGIVNKSIATDLGNTTPSDILYPSQKAVKAYVDAQTAAAGVADGSITNAKLAGSITADKLSGSIPASKLIGTDITTVGTITTGVWSGTAIANNKLANSALTLGTTNIALGATTTSLAGLTSVASTGFTGALTGNVTGNVTGALTGNASTATKLAAGKTIAITGDISYTSPSFDGSSNVTAAATIGAGVVTNDMLAGSIDVTTKLAGVLPLDHGGTGASTISAARTNLGLGTAATSSIGDFSAPLTFSAPLARAINAISIPAASSSVDGYLSSADWSTFNNKINASSRAAINGVASLGADGKIPSSQIPAISFSTVDVVANQTAMLALTGKVAGAIVVNTGASKNYVLSNAASPSLIGSWTELATPASISTVNGKSGLSVSIGTDDIAEGTTNKYFSNTQARNAISVSAPLSYNAGTGVVSLGTLPAANGGTGLTAVGTNGQILTSNGTNLVWSNPSATIGAATNATNLSGGAVGSIPYQTATNTTDFLAAGTDGQVLKLNGGVPTWAAIPMASATGVTAGLLSKSDYDVFNAKQAALSSTLVTIGSTAIALGGTATTIAGLTSVTSTGFTGALTGNATTATSATTATTAGNITATTNTTLTSLANLATVGTITTGTWSGTTIALANGGTGATTAAAARTNLGAEAVSNKSTATDLGSSSPSDILFPSQKAVKAYVDAASAAASVTDGSITNAKLAGSITASKLVGTDITTVGTITSGTWSGTTIALANGGTGATTAAAARTNLGLVIGTNVQAPLTAGTDYLTPTGSAASLTGFPTLNQNTTGNALTATTAGNITATTNTTLTSLANLATVGTITTGTWSGTTIALANGGTGASTAAAARTNLGAEAVSNKSTATDLGSSSPSDILFPSQKAVKAYVDAASAAASVTDGSITNAKLAGSITASKLVGTDITTVGTITTGVWSGTAIANNKLANSSTTIGTTNIALGASSTSLAGLTSVTSTGFTGALTGNVTGDVTGNATTATKLAATKNINGVAFDGSTNITIAADANTLTGTTLASNIVNSSLTSVGTITTGVWSGTAIANNKLANSSTTIGTTNIALGGNATTIVGLASVTSTGFTGALTGNATTATTAGNITATSNTTLTSLSNLATVGTITSGTWSASTIDVAHGGTGVTTSTGTGSLVLSTSPTLVTPILGTPTSATLTNATGLPIATGVSGLGTGIATFLATPTSANLLSAMSDETGTGVLVFANTPTLITPIIGAATGTSLSMSGNLTAAAGTFSSTLSAGASTLASASITGNETVGGTLGVTGATTLSSTLAAGASTFSSTVSVTGATTLGSTLAVTGAGTFSSTLSAGATTVASLVAPTITGGSSTTQSLTYKTTSGVGTTGADHIFQVGNNGATEAMRITNAANVGVGTNSPTAKFDVAAGTTTTNAGINLTGSINDYLEYNIKNTNTGNGAQSGYNAMADNGSDIAKFAWMGINSSTYSSTAAYNIGGANDVSFMGAGNDLYIANNSTTKSIIFSTGTSSTPFFAERMRITNAGEVAIGSITPVTGSKLSVTGSIGIADGTQAVGKVLTSDANGKATWQTGVSTLVAKTTSYTLTLNDNYVIMSTTAATGQTFTLPTAVGCAGKEFTIKNLSAFSVAIATTSTQYIIQDNSTATATSAIIGIEPSNNWIKIISDGTSWIAFRALF